MTNKQVMMVLPHMVGGGAERVASLLLNTIHSKGYDAVFLLTQSKVDEIINRDLDQDIPLILLSQECASAKRSIIRRTCSSFLSHIFEMFGRPVPASIARFSFICHYKPEIDKVRSIMEKSPYTTIIAFSQPSIPIVVLAAQGLANRVIISERADPNRLMKKRYGRPFIEKYYTRVDAAVFQTEEAKAVYPKCVSDKGTVIFNPIKSGLPSPYFGERNRCITTFCRISAQKNLPMLFEAFNKLHAEFPDYKLRIIGDALNDEGKRIDKEIRSYTAEHSLTDSVIFEPFNANVHEAIIHDAMYVNSSDYEGISNAMLEAMAIGMPTVCTDCPIGGAHAAINDGENGLLVPVGDSDALYLAMKRVITEEGLAGRLSHNAAKLRDELSLDEIAKKWLELI